MQVRNPSYTSDGRIDCEIDHPSFGWIPYTADGGSVDPLELAIHETALAIGPIAYAAPPPPTLPEMRASMQLTRRQVFIGMADAGLITASEAIAAAAVGAPPAAIEALFATLPVADQTPARITFAAFQTAYRLDAMTALFQSTAGMTDTAMDEFFTAYAAI